MSTTVLSSIIKTTATKFKYSSSILVSSSSRQQGHNIIQAQQIHSRGNNNNNISSVRNMSSATQLGFYGFKPLDKNNEPYDFEQLKGKVVLIVNVASKCGFTPQYEGLEKLHQKYKDQGLVVLGFPCSGFANQEYSGTEEIQSFCKLNYGVSFPVLKRVEVNGANAEPLYEYLKSEKPGLMGMKRIQWNFTKFLCDRDANVYARYGSTTKPESIAEDIEKLLAQKGPESKDSSL